MEYYKSLNFCFEPLNTNNTLEYLNNLHRNKESMKRIDLTDLNPELVDLMNLLGLRINHAESFYRLPSSISEPHIDVAPGDITKINWVYMGKESKLNFYSLLPAKRLFKKVTPIGTDYYSASILDIKLEDSCTVQNPSLVQVGVVHNVSNPLEERFCVSIVFVDKNNNRLTFDTAVKIFKDYIL